MPAATGLIARGARGAGGQKGPSPAPLRSRFKDERDESVARRRAATPEPIAASSTEDGERRRLDALLVLWLPRSVLALVAVST